MNLPNPQKVIQSMNNLPDAPPQTLITPEDKKSLNFFTLIFTVGLLKCIKKLNKRLKNLIIELKMQMRAEEISEGHL